MEMPIFLQLRKTNRMAPFSLHNSNLKDTIRTILGSNNFTNLIKNKPCFKGKASSIDLIPPTGNIHLSIHHHMKRDLVIIIIRST